MHIASRFPTWTILCVAAAAACGQPAFSQETAFTYQGRLADNNAPATGTYDVRFGLFDTNGVAILTPQAPAGYVLIPGVLVSNGLFIAKVDFGTGAFDGSPRMLDVSVRTNGASTFPTMTPRQALNPTPYAMMAAAVGGGGLSGTYSNAVTLNNAANNFTGNGAGLTGVNAATLGGQTGSYYQDASHLTAGTLDVARLPGSVALLDQSQAFSGVPAFNGGSSGATAPFYVDSTFLIPNLNADLLDGNDASAFSLSSHNHVGQSWTASGSYGLALSGTAQVALQGQTAHDNGQYGNSYGVYGISYSTSGYAYGVSGQATGSAYSGYGVYGYANGTNAYGVRGEVYGDAGPYGSGVSSYVSRTNAYGFATDVYGRQSAYGVSAYVAGSPASPQQGYGVNLTVYATNAYGVYAYAAGDQSSYGVYAAGSGQASTGYGVRGYSDATNAYGVNGYTSGNAGPTGYGVYGSSTRTNGYGVFGYALNNATNEVHVGVGAYSGGGDKNIGLFASSYYTTPPSEVYIPRPAAILGRVLTGQDIIQGFYSSTLRFRVSDAGTVYAVNTAVQPVDLAERVSVSEAVEPGDVMEVNPDARETFRKSRSAHSSRVAGVISTKPGLLLGHDDSKPDNDKNPPLALAGRVPVKVTLEGGPIQPGDLLTSASTPGYAMKAKESWRGGIIGTALEPFDAQPTADQEARGTVLALVQSRPAPTADEAVVDKLRAEVDAQREQIARLQRQVAVQAAANARWESRLAAIENQLAGGTTPARMEPAPEQTLTRNLAR
jgi:hypothetical protein